jgi:hypothetical protein
MGLCADRWDARFDDPSRPPPENTRPLDEPRRTDQDPSTAGVQEPNGFIKQRPAGSGHEKYQWKCEVLASAIRMLPPKTALTLLQIFPPKQIVVLKPLLMSLQLSLGGGNKSSRAENFTFRASDVPIEEMGIVFL